MQCLPIHKHTLTHTYTHNIAWHHLDHMSTNSSLSGNTLQYFDMLLCSCGFFFSSSCICVFRRVQPAACRYKRAGLFLQITGCIRRLLSQSGKPAKTNRCRYDIKACLFPLQSSPVCRPFKSDSQPGLRGHISVWAAEIPHTHLCRHCCEAQKRENCECFSPQFLTWAEFIQQYLRVFFFFKPITGLFSVQIVWSAEGRKFPSVGVAMMWPDDCHSGGGGTTHGDSSFKCEVSPRCVNTRFFSCAVLVFLVECYLHLFIIFFLFRSYKLYNLYSLRSLDIK